MAGELWTPIASMVGVVLGGGLTFLTQRTTQRTAERVEERKRQVALAEGVAHAKPVSWQVGDDWYRTARPAMDGLRVAEKSVELLCPESLGTPTAGYARALNQAVWQDRDDDTPLGEHLEPCKTAFLAAARHSLGS